VGSRLLRDRAHPADGSHGHLRRGQPGSPGHVVTTILIGMFAMLLTAVSYGRMARAYPSAGSAFTYVGGELHPFPRYATGWSMVMDYVLNPIICTIWCSKAAMNVLPEVPYVAWVTFFAALFTAMNLRGIKATARTNEILAVALGVVVLLFLGASVRYLLGVPPRLGRSHETVLRPGTFSLPSCSPVPRSRASPTSASTDFHALGGGREPSAEHHAGHGAHLSHHGRPGLAAGLRCAARVGQLDRLPRHRHGVRARGWQGRRPVLFMTVNIALLVATSGLAPARTSGRPPALRHGAQQRAPPRVLRRDRSAPQHPAQTT